MGITIRYPKPTQAEWETMFKCLENYRSYLIKECPDAWSDIAILEEIINTTLPPTVDEAFEQHQERIP